MGWLVWRARIPYRVRLPPHIDFPCTPNSPNIISRSASKVALQFPTFVGAGVVALWSRCLALRAEAALILSSLIFPTPVQPERDVHGSRGLSWTFMPSVCRVLASEDPSLRASFCKTHYDLDAQTSRLWTPKIGANCKWPWAARGTSGLNRHPRKCLL